MARPQGAGRNRDERIRSVDGWGRERFDAFPTDVVVPHMGGSMAPLPPDVAFIPKPLDADDVAARLRQRMAAFQRI